MTVGRLGVAGHACCKSPAHFMTYKVISVTDANTSNADIEQTLNREAAEGYTLVHAQSIPGPVTRLFLAKSVLKAAMEAGRAEKPA